MILSLFQYDAESIEQACHQVMAAVVVVAEVACLSATQLL